MSASLSNPRCPIDCPLAQGPFRVRAFLRRHCPQPRLCVAAFLESCDPRQKAEFMRQALAKSVSQKQKGLRWVAGGNHGEVLAAISDGAMFTDEMIQTVLADKDMHATRKPDLFESCSRTIRRKPGKPS